MLKTTFVKLRVTREFEKKYVVEYFAFRTMLVMQLSLVKYPQVYCSKALSVRNSHSLHLSHPPSNCWSEGEGESQSHCFPQQEEPAGNQCFLTHQSL